jgi:hypothetical protein
VVGNQRRGLSRNRPAIWSRAVRIAGGAGDLQLTQVLI